MKEKYSKNIIIASTVWISLTLASIIQNILIKGQFNNYLIFKGVFWHTLSETGLYKEYPSEYFDVNHYGIFFSLIIASFALLQDKIGALLWIITNSFLLLWAIMKLPLTKQQIFGIILISTHDLYTAVCMQQFNPSIISLLIATFIFIEKGKSHWATLFIVIGTLTKLYGIVGLAFFFFAKDKLRFIYSLIIWFILLFCLPMLISSPEFVIEQYKGWFLVLQEKNQQNTDISFNLQNLSLLGFLQRTGIYNNNGLVILSGIILFLLPYLRYKQFSSLKFRLMVLSSISLFLCLFSTGTENSTYIIAYVGIGLWYTVSPSKYKIWNLILLILTILASLSPTDLFKPIKENYIIHYSLRAIPPTLVWLTLIYEMLTLNYKDEEIKYNLKTIE